MIKVRDTASVPVAHDRGTAVVCLAAIAVAHLTDLPEKIEEAPYMAVLFCGLIGASVGLGILFASGRNDAIVWLAARRGRSHAASAGSARGPGRRRCPSPDLAALGLLRVPQTQRKGVVSAEVATTFAVDDEQERRSRLLLPNETRRLRPLDRGATCYRVGRIAAAAAEQDLTSSALPQ